MTEEVRFLTQKKKSPIMMMNYDENNYKNI